MSGTARCLRRARLHGAAVSVALVVSGCAQWTPDGGMAMVASIATADLGKQVTKVADPTSAQLADAEIRKRLARPLDADAAVQVALLANSGLQAAFAELGAMEAQAVEASLPPSPTVSIARFVATGQLEVERQIVGSILAILTLPRRREIASAKFAQAQLKTAQAVLRLAADTRRAYFRAVAAGQTVRFLEEALEAAQATSELAKRLGESGALNKLDQAREHAFTADLTAQLASARLKARTERERLTRQMGLWGGARSFRLPSRLPRLPRRARDLPHVEQEAVARNIEIAIARAELDVLTRQLGLTERTRLVNVLELRGLDRIEKVKTVAMGPGGKTVDVERTHWRGPELEIQIPLFDFGGARVRNAEQLYMQAAHRLAETAINARSRVREAYQTYRGTYDIARHYEREVLPLRKTIAEETQLRYNAMVSDLFQLLVDARARVMSNVAAIDALRDHWLASADLNAAIIGGGASEGGSGGTTTATATEAPAGGH